MRNILNILSIVLVSAFSLPATALFDEHPPLNSAEIDALVEKARQAFDIPGIAVGIIQDGQVIHAKGYGVRTLGQPETVDADTLFQIASNTKAMTTAALAILMDEGKLTWEDKVIDHIPEFKMHDPYVTKEFNIKDLLTHRSGLPLGAGDLLFWPNAKSNMDDLFNALPHLKPDTSFRTAYAYDNLLYHVAGEIVARRSGMPWVEFIEKRLMAPLGISDCRASHPRVPTGANQATPHALKDGKVTPTYFSQRKELVAAGGVNCSITSLLKWVSTQLNHGVMPSGKRLFSKERHGEMWSPVTIINVTPPSKLGEKVRVSHYALGWRIGETMGYQTISHTGGLQGMLTTTMMVPEKNLGILILTNQQNGYARGAIISKLLSGYLNHAQDVTFGARLAASKKRGSSAIDKMKNLWANRNMAASPRLPLKSYAMTYTDNWYGDIEIILENETLRFIAGRSPILVGNLRHFEGDTFVVEWDDRTLMADAYITFMFKNETAIERIVMKKFDPRTDFSYDFHHLDLRPK